MKGAVNMSEQTIGLLFLTALSALALFGFYKILTQK
jgi:hypothetical protein